MWWPALGGLAVGLVGLVSPRTLGVGYDNIEGILGGQIVGTLLISLCLFKFLSWSIALGSGTSGGTLAPLFTIGAGLGAVAGRMAVELMPSAGIDPRVAALVGMAAIFAGASRAMLASVIFAFETTRQTNGLLPLLGGCTMAYLLSCVFMKHTIMTEKIARRGKRVPAEYVADFLEQMPVAEVALKEVVCLRANQTVEQTLLWLEGERDHQGYPVLDERDRLVGVVTRRDLTRSEAGAETPVRQLIRRAPVVVFDDGTLRDAEDQMVREKVGRLPVVSRQEPWRVVGIITRSDLLAAHSARLDSAHRKERSIRLGGLPVRST
jgi:CBS domain-containing protein